MEAKDHECEVFRTQTLWPHFHKYTHHRVNDFAIDWEEKRQENYMQRIYFVLIFYKS